MANYDYQPETYRSASKMTFVDVCDDEVTFLRVNTGGTAPKLLLLKPIDTEATAQTYVLSENFSCKPASV